MPFKKISILFVEDNLKLHAEILDFLKSKKFKNIYHAHNGEDGLRQYYLHKPDLVLTDYTMPLMDGLEMSAIMKQNPLDIPIILITSHFLKEVTEKAIDIGIDGYLFKPLSLERLEILLERFASKIIRRRSSRKKQKLLEEYKNALDVSAAVTKTNTKGVVTYVNARFCEMTGYKKEELLGKTHRIIKHPETPKLVHKNIWTTLNQQKIWKGRIQNINKYGEAYHEHTVIIPILDEHDKTVEFIAVRQDVTKLYLHEEFLKKRIEEEVEKNSELRKKREQERLIEAKFSTIGKIAAGITHEINTPLTYIKGNLEMMLLDIKSLDDSIKEKSNLIEDSQTLIDGVGRITTIVESMREMAIQSSELPKSHNLYASLITALTLTHNKAKHITSIYLQDELFSIGMPKDKYSFSMKIQSQRIEQVFVIIINNALDVLKHVDGYDNRSIHITISKEDESIVIRFLDNGGGIDESILPTIFDPFTSKKDEGGIGIGLNVAQKIIHNNRGIITASNTENGALFEITLPCDESTCH